MQTVIQNLSYVEQIIRSIQSSWSNPNYFTMKNILFVSTLAFDPSFGGVERVTDKICKGLISKGYHCYYLCYPPNLNNSNIITAVKQDYFPESKYNSQTNVEFYHQYIKTHHIDVIINQEGLYKHSRLFLNTGTESCKKISVLHNDPLGTYDHLWSIMNDSKKPGTKDKIKRIIRCILYPKVKCQLYISLKKHFKFLLKNSDYIVTLSPQYEQSLKRINNKIKSTAIPNPNTYDIPPTHDTYQKENIVLYVGRLDENQKKLSRLIKIWIKISNKFTGWSLHIVGAGKDEDLYKKITSNMPNIVFWGHSTDPSEHYKRAKIICLTSNFEGFPLCIIEGGEFGCVPIAFSCYPAITDVVISGETGETVQPYNLDEYEEKLSRLMSNSQYLRTLSQNVQDHVKKFNIENIIPLWEELIENN